MLHIMAMYQSYTLYAITIGPVIENGFTRICKKEPFTNEDLNKIEKMSEIIDRDVKQREAGKEKNYRTFQKYWRKL